MQGYVVLGARLLADEIYDLAADVPGFRIDAFIENRERERCRETIAGIPIRWVDQLADFAASHLAICGISTTQRYQFVEEATRYGMKFGRLIHPSAQIPRHVTLSDGVIVSRGVLLGTKATLGAHVFLNRGVLIGHHTMLGDYVTVQPGANIAGACQVGARSYVGMGAIVLDHVTIGRGCIIGAGAVVTRDVPDHVQVVGVPARIVNENVGEL